MKLVSKYYYIIRPNVTHITVGHWSEALDGSDTLVSFVIKESTDGTGKERKRNMERKRKD